MKLDITIGERKRRVALDRMGSVVQGLIDGRRVQADVVSLRDGRYSILIGGRSIEVRVEEGPAGFRVISGGRELNASISDPRKFRRGAGQLSAEGRQNVNAPMPGKVVRLLVKLGEVVKVGQGLFVIEAMKMQNEIRSPKSGIVEKLLAVEGQPVNSGETLAVVA
ncbi:MAG TPA: biotin/lipoyl-containing protein [Candidatus Acidoferrales bacterium]